MQIDNELMQARETWLESKEKLEQMKRKPMTNIEIEPNKKSKLQVIGVEEDLQQSLELILERQKIEQQRLEQQK